jgi:hypothetical protein
MDDQLKTVLDLINDLTRITDEHAFETKAILHENMKKKRILTSLTRSSTNVQIFLTPKAKGLKKSQSKKTVTIQLQKRKNNAEDFLSKSLNWK